MKDEVSFGSKRQGQHLIEQQMPDGAGPRRRFRRDLDVRRAYSKLREADDADVIGAGRSRHERPGGTVGARPQHGPLKSPRCGDRCELDVDRIGTAGRRFRQLGEWHRAREGAAVGEVGLQFVFLKPANGASDWRLNEPAVRRVTDPYSISFGVE